MIGNKLTHLLHIFSPLLQCIPFPFDHLGQFCSSESDSRLIVIELVCSELRYHSSRDDATYINFTRLFHKRIHSIPSRLDLFP
jgi:hypothetical protein